MTLRPPGIGCKGGGHPGQLGGGEVFSGTGICPDEERTETGSVRGGHRQNRLRLTPADIAAYMTDSVLIPQRADSR